MNRFACLLVLLFCSSTFAGEKADWTLMFFNDLDTDLEAPMLEDIKEMMAVGSTDNVKLVVLADRSAKNTPKERYSDAPVAGLKDWHTAKVLHVTKGGVEEVGDWGEVSMGDPAVLEKFIRETAKAYPAKRYGLILSNHGAAWIGICTDETPKADILTLTEIQHALNATQAETGKLELIGFDACLMATLETADAMAPFAKFMVASEELEPGDGWNYTPLLEKLNAKTDVDGAVLGGIVVETYRDFFEKSPVKARQRQGMGVTLSLLNLEKTGALTTAANALAEACQGELDANGRAAWLKVAAAHAKTEEFGKTPKGRMEVFDLLHLSKLLKANMKVAGVSAAVDLVEAAAKDVVIANFRGKARANAGGISIFFPQSKELLTEQLSNLYATFPFGKAGKWLPFVVSYVTGEAKDEEAPDVQAVAATDPELAEGEETGISGTIAGDDVDESFFVLTRKVGEEHIVIGQIPAEPDEAGKLKEEWDGTWFALNANGKSLICPIEDFEEVDDEDDAYFVLVPAQVQSAGEAEWEDVTLYFYLDFNEEKVVGEFVYAYTETEGGMLEIELDVGDKVRPVYVLIDKDDNERLVASDKAEEILTFAEEDELSVKTIRVPKGTYAVGFTVTDYSGNEDAEFTEVKVD